MKFYNKCSENSRSQIVFRTDIIRKLTLGAPESIQSMIAKLDDETAVTEEQASLVTVCKQKDRYGFQITDKKMI